MVKGGEEGGGVGGGGKYDEKKVLKWLKMAYMQKNIWKIYGK